MSQLHKRLEQLVHYSSQLIFVSSDSIADQQRTLSEFLSLQHDTTEVSFFSADSEQSATDYRRIICRQLANHTVGSFVRPLNELLQDLDPSKGQYLVCISHAQAIESEFLQELWDWVTLCREHQQDLHINIILFAKQAWTEQAQTWLPSNNLNKPVLLSSQSIDAVGFDVSALESLMAQKRAFFAADDNQNILRNRWFITAVMSVFLLVFAALITMQYPEQVKHVLNTGALPKQAENAQTTSALVLPEQFPAQAEADRQPDSAAHILSYEAPLELVAQSEDTQTLFASVWPSQQNSEAAEQPKDFAVPDIVSVEQLEQQQTPSNSATSFDSAATELNIDQVTVTDISEPIQYTFDAETLMSLEQNLIVLQLSGMQNRSVLNDYLNDNNLVGLTWVYQTQRYGGEWFVVLFNQPFNSIDQAIEAVNLLPPKVQQSGPFAKQVLQVQQEIQSQ